jgi:hypothetical protein
MVMPRTHTHEGNPGKSREESDGYLAKERHMPLLINSLAQKVLRRYLTFRERLLMFGVAPAESRG